MALLKLTKNIGGKVIRVNPDYIIDIEEGQMDEDPEASNKTAESRTKTAAKDKQAKKMVTIVRRTKGKDLFVIETPEEINAQMMNIQEIKEASEQLVKLLAKLRSSLQT